MIPLPGGRLLLLLTFPLLLTIGSYFNPVLKLYALFLFLFITAAAVMDFLVTRLIVKLDFVLSNESFFSIGRENLLDLKVISRSKLPLQLKISLDIPEFLEDKTGIIKTGISPYSEKIFEVKLRPVRRGDFFIPYLFFRVASKAGLLHLQGKRKISCEIQVIPDAKKLNQFLKLSRMGRIYELGVHRDIWKGMGTELESLRDYQIDDDSRYIDWKASTRLNRPMTKVFQMESNNNVVIALDCGRLMTAEQDGLNTLDHAINSLLILSHIAFKIGDSVSIVAFSDHIKGEILDIKKKSSIKNISSFLSKLEPEFVESNYKHAMEYINKKVKKRSLVIFLTDMIDDINYDVFKSGVSRLSRRHLVLFILLRDIILSQSADLNIKNMDELYFKSAAQEMILRRSNAISKMRLNKINVMDVLPGNLTAKLINKYIELKSKNRL